MPAPAKGESKAAYLFRCMQDDAMLEKYPDHKQRYAVCNSLWESGGDAKSRASGDATTVIQPLQQTTGPVIKPLS